MHAFLKGGAPPPKPKAGPSDDGAKKKRNVPWVEKYRPKSVDDVAHQEEVVAVLKTALRNMDLPNLLFYGPPGTGKTSTILAAARQLFGPEQFRDRVLELNASDERGISVVRDKVKQFSQLAASGTRADGKPCPPFKIVILDEADSMTHPAQAALRRTMELQSKTTRFCLICNYVSRIIAPITSRCAKFRFKPLTEDTLRARIQLICERESVTCGPEAEAALVETSGGDLRKAITYLQSVSRLKGDEAVARPEILDIAGVISDDVIASMFLTCQSGSYEKVQAAVKDVMLEGYSAAQVLLQLHTTILTDAGLGDSSKARVLERLAIADRALMDGADEYLQVMTVCCALLEQFSAAA